MQQNPVNGNCRKVMHDVECHARLTEKRLKLHMILLCVNNVNGVAGMVPSDGTTGPPQLPTSFG